MKNKVFLSTPTINGNEWKYVKECIDTEWISSAGNYVQLFEQKISEYTQAKYAIACVNGTSALQLSLRLAGVQSDDEVIIPTLTFIAPVNAIAYNKARPLFMDADKYYNIDAEKTIDFILHETYFKDGFTYNKATKNKISAIVPVHIWGNAVWQDELVLLCKERNITIVEDASESLGTVYTSGDYKGRSTGTIGTLGCLSFNGNKIITTGGGGMILTNNKEFADKARYLTTQAKDDAVRYIHNEVGYNFRMTNIQAALGVAQLEQMQDFLKRKRQNFSQYQFALSKIDGLSLAAVPDYANNNHWMNLLQIDKEVYNKDWEKIMLRLKENGIQTRPVWTLNHMQKPYQKYQRYKLERAEKLINKSLCLPSSTNLTDNQIKTVITLLRKR